MTDLPLEPPETPTPPPPLERTISPIAGRFGGRGGRAVALAALVAGCGVFAAASWRTPRAAPAAPEPPPRQIVPFEPAAPTLATPGPGAPQLTPGAIPNDPTPTGAPKGGAGASASPTPADVRAAPLIAYAQGSAPPTTSAAAEIVPAIVPDAPAGELDSLRRSSGVAMAKATRLPDRDFLIVAGATLPCLLQTALDSTTPGYVSCLLPRDVLSDTGAVVLLEKGTRVLGEYRSAMRAGQTRLFVLWTRAVTPGGVAIRLDSPAADALGRGGFSGDLDTHFWDRFGSALLLSIVDGGAAALAPRDALGLARAPSDAASVALQSSVAIPPSLRKPQGAELTIFAAQDFDFSGVYGLKARRP